MLLEAYFMHIDNTWNRLQTLNEYIDDTEELVNLKLDQHRNQLISYDLLLTAFTSACAAISVVSGLFGMNLYNGLEEADSVFNAVALGTALGGLAILGTFVWFIQDKELLTLT